MSQRIKLNSIQTAIFDSILENKDHFTIAEELNMPVDYITTQMTAVVCMIQFQNMVPDIARKPQYSSNN